MDEDHLSGSEGGAVPVLLHGRGDDPASMLALARRAGCDPGTVQAPAAPGGSWYPNRFVAPLAANEPYLSAALDRVDALLDALAARGVDERRIVLGGFSQGACLASEVLARRPRSIGALVVLCGGLIGAGEAELTRPPDGSLAGLAVLLTGTEGDAWVPVARSAGRRRSSPRPARTSTCASIRRRRTPCTSRSSRPSGRSSPARPEPLRRV